MNQIIASLKGYVHKSFSAVRIPCMGKASCNEGFVDGLNGTANHFLFRFIQYLWF